MQHSTVEEGQQSSAIKGAKVQIVVTCEPHFYGRRLGNFCNIQHPTFNIQEPPAANAEAAWHEEFIVRAKNGQGRQTFGHSPRIHRPLVTADRFGCTCTRKLTHLSLIVCNNLPLAK